MSLPRSRTWPWRGLTRPITALIKVDLPAPLGPTTSDELADLDVKSKRRSVCPAPGCIRPPDPLSRG